MGLFRVRCVKLSTQFGAGNDFLNAVQISTDGLVWWTMGRFNVMDEALGHAKALEKFVQDNHMVKPEFILWQTKKV